MTTPSTEGVPIQPETAPRWATGTRSGTAAVSDASMVLKQVCAATQASATPAMVCWRDSRTSAAAPSRAPPRVQTWRRLLDRCEEGHPEPELCHHQAGGPAGRYPQERLGQRPWRGRRRRPGHDAAPLRRLREATP